MLLKRVFKWQCDKCKQIFEQEGYGLPKGWIYIPKLNGPVEHRCKSCEDKRKLNNGLF